MGIFSQLFGTKKTKEQSEAEILASLGLEIDPALLEEPNLDDLDVDLDALQNDIGEIGDMDGFDDVELTEDDLNDPDLLAGLKEMGWESEEDETQKWTETDERQLLSLAAKIEEGKARAKQCKATGDTSSALEELREVKRLTSELAALEARKLESMALAAAEVVEAPVEALVEEAASNVVPEDCTMNAAIENSSAYHDVPPVISQSQIGDLEVQIAAKKKEALAFKQEGRKSEALLALQSAKALQVELDALKSSDPPMAIPLTKEAPEPRPALPPTSDPPTASAPIMEPPPDGSAPKVQHCVDRASELEALISSLKREAIELRKNGQNTEALDKLKDIKRLEQERKALTAASP